MLNELAENVWIAEGKCVDFHGFAYPTRSVIIRLGNGDLWIWSPISLADDLTQWIDELGTVKHLISPNKLHHLYLTDWHKKYASALLWGPKSIQDKRQDLSFQPPLAKQSPNAWNDEFELFHVQGSLSMDEILFLHKPSKTLIMADFSENFEEEFLKEKWRGWQRWIARRWGIVVGKGYAPLDWRLSFIQRKKLRVLKEELLCRDIDHVVMAHGQIEVTNARRFLKTSLAWI